MEEKEKILIENFEEYYSNGLDSFNKGKFNVAITLFFKSIATLCDLYILKNSGFVPSSHTNRFRILEEKYEDIYRIVDRDFSFYQDSYTKKIDKESALLFRKDVEILKKLLKI